MPCFLILLQLGRYGGPLDFKVERFTCGGCLHFLLMVVGFAHRYVTKLHFIYLITGKSLTEALNFCIN